VSNDFARPPKKKAAAKRMALKGAPAKRKALKKKVAGKRKARK
jgi:hypothetical protein